MVCRCEDLADGINDGSVSGVGSIANTAVFFFEMAASTAFFVFDPSPSNSTLACISPIRTLLFLAAFLAQPCALCFVLELALNLMRQIPRDSPVDGSTSNLHSAIVPKVEKCKATLSRVTRVVKPETMICSAGGGPIECSSKTCLIGLNDNRNCLRPLDVALP